MNPSITPAANNSMNMLDLVLHSGPTAKLVFLSLMLCSVFSWAIILSKRRTLRIAHDSSQAFLKMFWQAQDLEEIFLKSDAFARAPIGQMFRSGFRELKKLSAQSANILQEPAALDNISRALSRTTMTELESLEVRVGILATIASAAPFIGLFGTVWGIMDSFQSIGLTGSANLAVVAPGISEALVNTAAGLFAAIPALVAYNLFQGRLKSMGVLMDTFHQDLLNLIQRSILKR